MCCLAYMRNICVHMRGFSLSSTLFSHCALHLSYFFFFPTFKVRWGCFLQPIAFALVLRNFLVVFDNKSKNAVYVYAVAEWGGGARAIPPPHPKHSEIIPPKNKFVTDTGSLAREKENPPTLKKTRLDPPLCVCLCVHCVFVCVFRVYVIRLCVVLLLFLSFISTSLLYPSRIT